MIPNLFLYKEIENEHLFYVLEFSTLDCVKLLPQHLEIEIIDFGATLYKKFGFANETDIPKLKTVQDLTTFLEKEGELGLICFEMIINNFGKMSSHDDGECTLELNSKSDLLSIIKNILPFSYQDKLLSYLMNYQNHYLKVNEQGNVLIYPTFDDYLKANN